jgi:hypothetical protein
MVTYEREAQITASVNKRPLGRVKLREGIASDRYRTASAVVLPLHVPIVFETGEHRKYLRPGPAGIP